MVLINLAVLCPVFILRQVLYCRLTVEAIYSTTYFRMKKDYYSYLLTELELSIPTLSLPKIILAEPSKWGGHGR